LTRYSFEVNPEAEKKLRATFKVMFFQSFSASARVAHWSQAPLLKKLEQLNEKNANSYVRFFLRARVCMQL
jgi:hypothetical protein